MCIRDRNNTLIVTLLSIIGTLLTAAMVAYAFARLRWPGRDGLFIVLLATTMLPGAVTMIPQFLIWQNLGFVDTLVPLWAVSYTHLRAHETPEQLVCRLLLEKKKKKTLLP